MKLLLDENLSRRIVLQIEDLFPESIHVSSVDLLQASDRAIWEFARAEGYCIVTADADFYEMAISLGFPPKIIWLRECDYPTSVAAALIRRQTIRIVEFLNDAEQAVLMLRQ